MKYLLKLFSILIVLNTILFLNTAFASSSIKATHHTKKPTCIPLKICNTGRGSHVIMVVIEYHANQCTHGDLYKSVPAFQCHTIDAAQLNTKIEVAVDGVRNRKFYLTVKRGEIDCWLRKSEIFNKKAYKCDYI